MGFGANGHRRVGGLVAVTLLLAAAGAAAAPVPVRGAAHKDYGRLVFDWPQKVEFTARVEGERLIVTFDQPIEAAVDKAVASLSAYLAAGRIAAYGKTVEFDLKRPVAVRSFRNGNGVALDLTPSTAAAVAAAAKTEPAAPPKAEAPKAEAPAKPAAPSPPTQAQAASAGVKLRAGDHPTHSRMVFEWTAPVDYTLQRDGASVTMLFDKAAQADLSPATKAKLRNITNMEQFRAANGGLGVTFAAPPDADVREFRNGKSVIVDVLNPGTRKAATPAEPPQAPTQTAAAPQPVAPQPMAQQPAASAPAAQPPAAQPAPAQPAKPPTPQTPTPATATQTAPAQPAMQPVTAAPAKPVEREKGPALVFDAGGPAAAAVYPRAGYLYVVFDKPLPIGAGSVVGSGAEQVGPVEPVPATGGSAFRTRIGPFIWPQVERQGTVWRIVPMTRMTAPPAEDLRIDTEPDFLLGARLVVRALDAASVVQLTDPEVGDRLHIVPLPRPGQAVNDLHRYADLEVLPSFQGVAVRPIADSLTVRPVKEGIELTSAGGLHLSPTADMGSRSTVAQASAPLMPAPAAAPPQGGASPGLAPPPNAPPRLSNKRLFDLDAWQHGGAEKYTDARQALQFAIVDAPESERPRAQLELARFYFANGMGAEAQGMLDVLQSTQPDLEGWAEFKALRGAARVLSGDLEGAAEDLKHPALADNAEAGLWRGAVAAQRNDWPAAARGFKAASAILSKYPEPLLSKLATLAAEAALQTGDTTEAKRLLDRIEARIGPDADERPDMQYLRGELARQQGDSVRAHEALSRSYNSLDRYHRAKAGLALVNLELAEGKTSPAAAAERLAGLTFTWRGDDMEMAIRQRLGDTQVAAGEFAAGFNTMKDTAALIGDGPRAEKITKDMAHAFADLYKDGAARMPTMEALKLYDQFRELTPVGPAGDEIIRQLAERLVQIDLLDRAADLLQYQTEYRLAGADKAYVGTRLATVRLLDNKPAEALKALEISNVPDMPAELAAERRLMQAKALDQMGRGNDALQLLAQDDTKESNLLRIDMAWRAQNWGHAAVALGKVIGQPPAPGQPLEEERSQLVLNRAVALALGGDGTGLAQLRKEFGGAMDKSQDADAFRVLTRPEQATGLIDVNTIRSRVAEVDVFQKFLKSYKGRLSGNKPNS